MNDKKKIVWISAYVPYDGVPHAGGKIHNYYIKKLIECDKYNVRLISFMLESEMKKFTLDTVITCYIKVYFSDFIHRVLRNIEDIFTRRNPFHKYAGYGSIFILNHIKNSLKKCRDDHFCPDVIILEWTQVVLYAKQIKKYFPGAKIVAIEEDVSFQAIHRRYNLEKNICKKFIYKVKERNLKKHELAALQQVDLTILNNEKDRNLLRKEAFNGKIFIWSPFFQKNEIARCGQNVSGNIIFWGAMNRFENEEAALWFINNVLPRIDDLDIKFYIVGANPSNTLCSMQNNRIIVTGFVENVEEYFRDALCLVAPLHYGAGIKIKILESMYAGVTTITNDVGIEGIAKLENDCFIYADSVDEYVNAIRLLATDSLNGKIQGLKAHQYIKEQFNYERSAEQFISLLDSLQ